MMTDLPTSLQASDLLVGLILLIVVAVLAFMILMDRMLLLRLKAPTFHEALPRTDYFDVQVPSRPPLSAAVLKATGAGAAAGATAFLLTDVVLQLIRSLPADQRSALRKVMDEDEEANR